MSDLSDAIRNAIRGVRDALADGKISAWEALRLAPAIFLVVTEAQETFTEKTYDELRDVVTAVLQEFDFQRDGDRDAVGAAVMGLVASAKESA